MNHIRSLSEALGSLDYALQRLANGWRRGRNDPEAAAEANAAAETAMSLLALAPDMESERHGLGMVRSFVARHGGQTGQSEPVLALEQCVATYDRQRWKTLLAAWERPTAQTAALLAETLHLSEASPAQDVRTNAATMLRERNAALH